MVYTVLAIDGKWRDRISGAMLPFLFPFDRNNMDPNHCRNVEIRIFHVIWGDDAIAQKSMKLYFMRPVG